MFFYDILFEYIFDIFKQNLSIYSTDLMREI